MQAQKRAPFEVFILNDIQPEGCAGAKIVACIVNDILKTDPGYPVHLFTMRNEKYLWRGEFWGKWITLAAGTYNYTKDGRLPELVC